MIEFPPVEQANENGLLAIGGDLEIETLVSAYSQGIFPWPMGKDYPLTWFSPDPRGILCWEHLHIPRSLKKIIRKNIFDINYNHDFETIIWACADRVDTWLTKHMISAYIKMFRAQLAYCVGCYQQGKLVGGLYGVRINNFVSAESMFYRQNNASKVALIWLMEHLQKEKINWLDTQMTTEVVASLGGYSISRKEFMTKLKEVISQP